MKINKIFLLLAFLFSLQVNAQTSVTYTYDDLNRLTGVHYSNGVTVTYAYDALGNRIGKTVTTSSGGGVLRGDVDGDGIVNIHDVTALINYLLNGDASEINLENADCCPDGRVNIDDLTTLINFLLTDQWE